MSGEETPSNDNMQRNIPPPPSERSLAKIGFVFAVLGMAVFGGVWLAATGLEWGWRFVVALVVASPFFTIPNLLRDKSAPPPGFKPRKWEDDDE